MIGYPDIPAHVVKPLSGIKRLLRPSRGIRHRDLCGIRPDGTPSFKGCPHPAFLLSSSSSFLLRLLATLSNAERKGIDRKVNDRK